MQIQNRKAGSPKIAYKAPLGGQRSYAFAHGYPQRLDKQPMKHKGREGLLWRCTARLILTVSLLAVAGSLAVARPTNAADVPLDTSTPVTEATASTTSTPESAASPVLRPVLTPSTEFGGMPVVYAGAGDGSWPDQMEPNDGAADSLGPAPVEVGTLYRSLNMLPRTEPQANPTPGEDRDWYVWEALSGRCYRAFTGDITWHAASGGQSSPLLGKSKVQHSIRIWWYPPVNEGRKLLAEYTPNTGPAGGGYFAAAAACAPLDGQMAAEIFNYSYALKNPRGLTYTFGVLDVGTPQVAPVEPQTQPGTGDEQSGFAGNSGSQAANTSPVVSPGSPSLSTTILTTLTACTFPYFISCRCKLSYLTSSTDPYGNSCTAWCNVSSY